MKRVRVKVYGEVQKVGFRSFLKRLADTLSLDGWARNNPDGSIEILVEGRDGLVDDFLKYCREGPALAKIDKMDVKDEPLGDRLRGFEIVL